MEKEEENEDLYVEIWKATSTTIDFESWNDVIKFSEERPDELLKVLLIERQYDLAKNWITVGKFTERFLSHIPSVSLLKLLDIDFPDLESAENFLNNIEDVKVVDVVENLLDNIDRIVARKFLISYIISRDCSKLKSVDLWTLQQELMGIILMEDVALETCNKSQLLSLINHPNLIIEQWIMNLKLACVDKGIQKISSILDLVKCRNVKCKESILKHEIDCLCWDHYYTMIEKYAVKALNLTGNRISLQKMLMAEESGIQFVMPHKVPSKSDWQKSSTAKICPVCKITVFSIFCIKHHCRRCGRVVCSDCSLFRHIVEGYGDVPVRICEFCYRNMTENLSGDNNHMVNIKLSAVDECDNLETTSTNSSIDWNFTTDPLRNRRLREEFDFDFTPSLSVCHALFALHKDNLRAALSILNLCHKIFEKVVNSISLNLKTVDRFYVIKIINVLLISAKIRFQELINFDGVSVCEYYRQWSNWVQNLLHSNIIFILPRGTLNNVIEIGELRQLQLLQQGSEELLQKKIKQEKIYLKVLKDNAVKNGSYDLALDISTKEGLDKGSIWKAHGIASLKSGDFKTARQQFSKVLKKNKNKNLNVKIILLEEIILILESNNYKNVSSKYIERSPRDNCSLNECESDNNHRDDFSPFSSVNLKECEYYLRLYGSHKMYLDFLTKHGILRESVEYCKQEMLDEIIFCDCILLPSFKLGNFKKLWSVINDVDPKQSWSSNLIYKSYRYLNEVDVLSCLLEVQKALKDNIRAATTLIKMYKNGADSYEALLSRNSYLKEALALLNEYLNSPGNFNKNDKNALNTTPFQFSDIPKFSNKKSVERLKMLIDAQYYLTDYLSKLEKHDLNFKSKINSVREILKTKEASAISNNVKTFVTYKVPTLFESQERVTICAVLLCLDSDFELNLEAIRKLVDENCLDVENLLSLALQIMVRAQEFQNLSRMIKAVLNWECIPASRVKGCLCPALTLDRVTLPEQAVLDTIKFLKETEDKMDVFIEVGMLKLAFTELSDGATVDIIERLRKAAEEKGDGSVVQRCSKWLHNKRSKRRVRNVKVNNE